MPHYFHAISPLFIRLWSLFFVAKFNSILGYFPIFIKDFKCYYVRNLSNYSFE